MTTPPTYPSGGTKLSLVDSFEVHRQMVITLFIATLGLVVILIAGLFSPYSPALMVVAAAGALGGFVSALRRLYTFQKVFPTDFLKNRRRINGYLVVYSMIPSLVGAIAAVVLYLIFAAELIKGGTFPNFHLSTVDLAGSEFHNFVQNWQPVESTDYAKAFVWSFIAGFSERFVPNLLDHFASVSEGNLVQSGNGVSKADLPVDDAQKE